MKKFSFYALLMLGVASAMTSCKDDSKDDDTPVGQNIEVSENITANTTWTTGNTYTLTSRVAVEDGATLTIEPGVVVKGAEGTGANATALIIAQGAKIMAEGTASQPIIFTSVIDGIKPGQIASPNMEEKDRGNWGGLIILGKAPISVESGTSASIEGIPPSDPNGVYGGNDADDNSGVLKYVSVRHGGANIGDGNEINGITLGGVGSGTEISNIEVVSNTDDGIEFFGGTVDASNIVVWSVGDDAIDIDQAYAGTVSNFIVVCGDLTDHALEIDGPEGAYVDAQTVTNGTVKGANKSELGNWRDGAQGNYSNIYFFGFTDPATNGGKGDFALDSLSNITFGANALQFSNLEVTLPAGVALDAVFKDGTDAHATNVTTPTVGVSNVSGFSWTATSRAGMLSDF